MNSHGGFQLEETPGHSPLFPRATKLWPRANGPVSAAVVAYGGM